MIKKIKKIKICLMAIFLMSSVVSVPSYAALVNIEGNNYLSQSKIPQGKTGKIMNVTFSFTPGRDYDKAFAGIAYDDQTNSRDDGTEGGNNDLNNAFPFELTSETTKLRSLGKLQKGKKKTVTLQARVRRDIPEGYYGVKIYITDDGNSHDVEEYVNVWISKSTEAETTEETTTAAPDKNALFMLGEGQETPYGVYPNVMNFAINLRNNGKTTAYDVTAHMVLDKDSKVFPFDINEVSYDHYFDHIDVNQVMQMNYSFMIRKDTYSGTYPIKLQISYRDKEFGELKTLETEFYVNIKNKEVVETTTAPETTAAPEFNANERSKARIVVDSYQTIPEKVIAGQEFELVINMKNATTNLNASNILFSLESEKVSDSAVFTTSSGSNSFVVNSLAAGATTQLRVKMTAKPGVDQRSYGIKIGEKYDSPDFKNAEESVNIDVPVYQVARLGIGNIDAAPASIAVGEESDVTFQINNTGKVVLYNVSAKFTGDSIKENEVYVGNIKPGESGNVDAMIKGANVSTEDEKVKILISYEDENGQVSTEEKEMDLPVTDANASTEETSGEEVVDDNTKKGSILPKILIPLVVLVGGGSGGFIYYKKRKKREDGE